MRIAGYERYKIGDTFQVPIEPTLELDSEKVLQALLRDELPECIIQKYKTYIRLPDGDKEINPTTF